MLPEPTLDDPDDAWANAPHIPEAERFVQAWPVRAAAYRAAAEGAVDVPYGDARRERLDLFAPAGASRGLAVIVHGGYWLRFDRQDFSHLAAGAVARGWHVAMPSYPLCPHASIAAITRSVARAVQTAAARVAGPIRLAGHSAGGQLVTRQLCSDGALLSSIAARIEAVLSISGVHDLVPLLGTTMNAEALGLDRDAAIAASPARGEPSVRARVTCWVGSAERPEFIRQNALLEQAWRPRGVEVVAHVEPARHHFDVIEDLERADSPMLEAWLDA